MLPSPSTIDFCNKITLIPIFPATFKSVETLKPRFRHRLRIRSRSNVSLNANQNPLRQTSISEETGTKPTVMIDSLRVLGWNKLCDVVSSFARTSLGCEATKEQLWSLDQTYEESLRLLKETNAAVEIHKFNNVILDLGGVDSLLVISAIQNARRGFPVNGKEAISIASMLQYADTLQVSLKAALKENSDMYTRFMPLIERISAWSINRSLVKLIVQVVDEDGTVKDSAIPKLKQARRRVQELEKRLYQLMNNLVDTQLKTTPTGGWEVSNIDGRWCIRSGTDDLTGFNGLLLSSGSNVGNIFEPISSVPLNDELQEAMVLVAEAEAEVLFELTTKMQMDLEDLQKLLKDIIELDVVNARASYSLSFGGVCPELLPADDNISSLSAEAQAYIFSYISHKEWNLYLPKAYHPLLLQQYRQKLKKAREDIANARAEIRRRRSNEVTIRQKEATDIDLPMLQLKVTELEEAHPVPVDFFIDKKTRVLLITGPNAGGKTIGLKTVGLASMMAKSGLYVLCSESARIPWFDSVFADIGDEQSLSQSLSTFSGHLKKISNIRARSSSQSLVLLDEIGAGTNPLEGAALGMSVLESFAEAGALLTIATTHHGELKTLKYSNAAFENACMEFDEVNLKPTYKILWGIPAKSGAVMSISGRSNAINIAERLGLPNKIIDSARELYGTTSSEIDEIIADMEKFKLETVEKVREAAHYLKVSKDLHQKLLLTQRKLNEYSSKLRYTKMQQISEAASMACLVLHKKKQQYRTTAIQSSKNLQRDNSQSIDLSKSQQNSSSDDKVFAQKANTPAVKETKKPSSGIMKVPPKVGDEVHVSSLGMKARILKIEPYKDEIVVQAGNLKLKLKAADIRS
ncbi:hypothetical protein V2J09_005746 [Rumex salicifolius]